MKNLIVIDPAKVSGVAIFNENGELCKSLVVKPMGGKGKWYAGAEIYESQILAWDSVYRSIRTNKRVIIERGFGAMMTAVRAQGIQIGWHNCMCANYGIESPTQVNVSEWRRVIKEDQSISWPKESERCKALSVQLAEKLYSLKVTADESDAILLGRAAIRMGLAN